MQTFTLPYLFHSDYLESQAIILQIQRETISGFFRQSVYNVVSGSLAYPIFGRFIHNQMRNSERVNSGSPMAEFCDSLTFYMKL